MNLGDLALVRSKASLSVHAIPPAPVVTIHGPEFNKTLKNVSETNIIVPTGLYSIEAQYRNWEKREEILVASHRANSAHFAPPFGALRISSSNSGASFELSHRDRGIVGSGALPQEITELPEGKYQMLARHRDSRKETTVEVKAKATNDVHLDFVYGAAFLKTEPSGAMVLSSDGRILGNTPLLLPELEPGRWSFVLRRGGYEPVLAELDIPAHVTNTFEKGLVNASYAGEVKAARAYMESGQFNLAYESALAALRVNPDDEVALELKRKASGFESLRLARMLAKDGDYTAALAKVRLALEALPGNGEASALVEPYTRGERETAERKHKEWLNRGNKLFEAVLAQFDGANLFERHEVKTEMTVNKVEEAIVEALKTGDPAYIVTSSRSPEAESFLIKAYYNMPLFSLKSGRRDVIIVGTQRQTNETEILFKILEYKPDINKPISELSHLTYVPIHSSRIGLIPGRLQTQVKEGMADVTARIQRAVIRWFPDAH
jgi:tetratricopeptide (TPR) repeat protein